MQKTTFHFRNCAVINNKNCIDTNDNIYFGDINKQTCIDTNDNIYFNRRIAIP